MSRNPNDMHSPQNRQPSGDDRRRGSAHYPQMYESVDHSGGQVSPTRSAGRVVETDSSRPEQNQQRMIPVGSSRPPVANNAPTGRGAGTTSSRPPSYPGLGSEERSEVKTDAGNPRQQDRRRGYRRTEDPAEDWGKPTANPQSNARPGPIQTSSFGPSAVQAQLSPVTRDRGNAPPSNRPQPQAQKGASPPRTKDSTSAGTAIPRLNSPSVMSSVLQPLDKKVQEYDGQMKDAQKQMARFDADIAALQERRRAAERLYMSAKTKHDDYRRQYQGVERAMRGEPEVFTRLSYDDDDDEHERPSTQHTLPGARPHSPIANSSRTESWSSLKKSKTEGRFRLSKLFGAS